MSNLAVERGEQIVKLKAEIARLEAEAVAVEKLRKFERAELAEVKGDLLAANRFAKELRSE